MNFDFSASSLVNAFERLPRAIAVPHPGTDQMEGPSYSHDGSVFLVADERGATNSELTIVAAGTGPAKWGRPLIGPGG